MPQKREHMENHPKGNEVIKKSFSDVTYEEVVLIKENLPFA